jgi:hypothetical protein
MAELKRHCPTCDVWVPLTEQTRDKPVRCPKCKTSLAPQPASQRRRGVSVEVEERAARLSLRLTELTSEVQDRIEGELAEGERIVWIGRPAWVVKFVRPLPRLLGGSAGLVMAPLLLSAGTNSTEIGRAFLLAGLVVGFVGAVLFVPALIRMLIPDSRVYVLTTRRAVVFARRLFGGIRATSFGPEEAAFPGVRRAWFVSDAGDLVMRTVSRRRFRLGFGGKRSRTYLGFVGIRHRSEVKALLADTLGHHLEARTGSTAYRSLSGVFRFAGYALVSLLVLLFCLALARFAFGSQPHPKPRPADADPEPKCLNDPLHAGRRGDFFRRDDGCGIMEDGRPNPRSASRCSAANR